MDGGTGGDDVGHGKCVETEYHDEYGAHGGEEDFFPKAMKRGFVVVAWNVTAKEYRAGNHKCEENEDFRNSCTVSPTPRNFFVVWKFNGDEECEVERENDIDERVATLCHCVEKEHTKNREEKRKFFEEGENCRGIHRSIIVRNVWFVV